MEKVNELKLDIPETLKKLINLQCFNADRVRTLWHEMKITEAERGFAQTLYLPTAIGPAPIIFSEKAYAYAWGIISKEEFFKETKRHANEFVVPLLPKSKPYKVRSIDNVNYFYHNEPNGTLIILLETADIRKTWPLNTFYKIPLGNQTIARFIIKPKWKQKATEPTYCHPLILIKLTPHLPYKNGKRLDWK